MATPSYRQPTTDSTRERLLSCAPLGALVVLLLFACPDYTQAAVGVQGRYLENADHTLAKDAALKDLIGGGGIALHGLRFNLGNRDSRFWIYYSLHNDTGETLTRLLDTGVPFRAGLTVYKVGGEESVLLQTNEAATFTERGTNDLMLRTVAFTLAPGERTTLLLDYTTRGTTYMPMALRTPEAFAARMQQGDLWSAIFYAASLVLLIVFLLLGLGLRDRFVLMYAGLFALGLLFVAASEGYAFKYLWPNAPGWNQYAPLFLLLFATGMSFFVALAAMTPGTLPGWGRRLVAGLGALSLLLSALCTLLPFSPLIDAASLLMLLAYLTQVITVISWLREAVARNLVTLVSTLVAVPITIVLLLLGIMDFDLPDVAFSHGLRIAYFFTVTMTLASLVTHITALRLDHEKAMTRALRAAQRDAELSRAVIESEHRYNKAKELAATRQRQLASTSHDIRQPLTSLRAVVDQLPQDLGERERSILQRSLDYIEEISHSHRAEPRESKEEFSAEAESYRADLLLHTVKRMFQAEAESRGTELRVAPCSAEIQHPPLVLMRILSNLASNAVKHCEGGDVLLGCRRVPGGLRYDVIDTGRGMEEEELARVILPHEKGESSSGEGLGLAICRQLAAEHGFTMQAASRPGKGTRFSLRVPTGVQPIAAAI